MSFLALSIHSSLHTPFRLCLLGKNPITKEVTKTSLVNKKSHLGNLCRVGAFSFQPVFYFIFCLGFHHCSFQNLPKSDFPWRVIQNRIHLEFYFSWPSCITRGIKEVLFCFYNQLFLSEGRFIRVWIMLRNAYKASSYMAF